MELITQAGLDFYREIREKSGQPIELCYQCQKCAAGCIANEYADYYPNEIIRLVQLGQKEKVLQCKSIWICSSCETCGARCPNGINTRAINDALKEKAIAENLVKDNKVYLFHRQFLNSVLLNGRVHEPTMLALYKLKSKDLWSDLDFGLKLFTKGKMPLLPHRVKNRRAIKEIFNQSQNQ
ncbi:MAG: 4Fe-4S dicluster domain-containing protein [Firmicutes bacterium]|nr:4Fe-4S dicluster domain-containing protein [Bacillota bacterium]